MENRLVYRKYKKRNLNFLRKLFKVVKKIRTVHSFGVASYDGSYYKLSNVRRNILFYSECEALHNIFKTVMKFLSTFQLFQSLLNENVVQV